MSLLEVIILAIGLAMDCFAVSICKGLSFRKFSIKNSIIIGTWFGVFQGGMLLIGYFLAFNFIDKIQRFDHWIAFILLAFIGGNMIRESRSSASEEEACTVTQDSLSTKELFVLAVATSIDALAVGVTMALLKAAPFSTGAIVGAASFLISILGVKIGSVFGSKYKSRAEMIGGIILICIGLKTLLEHLGIILVK